MEDKKLVWESIAYCTYRLNVHGGWLVKTMSSYETNSPIAMVFVEDLTHIWKL